ncbi:MAG: ATP phosphoribosyltransferase regulatory subunit, partial [Clostridia bacterium]
KGFFEVVTPTIEFYDVYNDKNIYIPQEHMYKLIDQKGRLLVLRPDSTAPIARIVATRLKNSPLPIRLFYNQDVYKVSPKLSGRDDILNQIGAELIGTASIKSDFEMILNAFECIKNVSENKKFRIEIGHIGIFKFIISKLNATEQLKEEIRKNIECKNYAALNDILSKLEQTKYTNALKQLPQLFGNEEVFQKAKQIFDDIEIIKILNYLEKIYLFQKKAGYEKSIMIDLGIVNEVDYYTGIIFKGYLEGSGDVILSGGRYDNLTEKYGIKMPAIGFAINLNFIINTMNFIDLKQKTPDFLVYADDEFSLNAMDFIKNNSSSICEFSCDDSLENAKNTARKKGIKKLVLVTEKIEYLNI